MTAGILMIAGVVLMARVRFRCHRAVAAMALVVGLVATGALASAPVKSVGYAPGIPDDLPLTCGERPRVCTRDPGQLPRVHRIVQRADAAWRRAGVTVPREYVESAAPPTSDIARWMPMPEHAAARSEEEMVAVLADAVAVAPCQYASNTDQESAAVSSDILLIQERVRLWLLKTAGYVPRPDPAQDPRSQAETAAWLAQIGRRPLPDQVKIIEAYRQKLRSC